MWTNNNQSFHVLVIPDENDGIIDQCGDFLVINKEESIFIKQKNASWEISMPDHDRFKLRIVENNLTVFYQKDGYIHALKVGLNGNVLYSGGIIPNRLHQTWDVKVHDEIWICGTIEQYEDASFIETKEDKVLNKQDAILIALDLSFKITKWKIWGGLENEGFESLAFSNEKIFLVGKKDPYSGGDFGNGGLLKGNNFICMTDFDFNLLDFLILDNNYPLIFNDFMKESLFVCTNLNLYKINENLEIVKKRIFDKEIFHGLISEFNIFIGFEIENIALVDILDLQEIGNVAVETINEETAYKQMEKTIKIKNGMLCSYLDVIDLRHFYFSNIYYDNLPNPGGIKSLFGEVNIVDKISYPQFNPLVFGNYHWLINLENSFGLSYSINREQLVQKEVNVTEGYIYPLGYQLRFTGNATLNGKPIVNNYTLNQSGNYRLVLQGLDEEKYEVGFFVEREQIHIQETETRNWHYETRKGGLIQINFSLQGEWEGIEAIVINNENYENVIFDQINHHLHIRFLAPETMGIYDYLIESIIYKQNNDLRSFPINQMITVNVLGLAPEVVIEETSDFEFVIKVDDGDSCSRSISVHALSNLDDIFYNYPLSDTKILLNNLKKTQNYEVKVFLNYDLGNHQMESIEILNTQISGRNASEIGEITIIEKGASLKKWSLSLLDSKNSILQIVANNHFVYQKPINNLFDSMLIGGASFVCVLFISWSFQKWVKRRQKRYF